jgi:hypothetical protein
MRHDPKGSVRLLIRPAIDGAGRCRYRERHIQSKGPSFGQWDFRVSPRYRRQAWPHIFGKARASAMPYCVLRRTNNSVH